MPITKSAKKAMRQNKVRRDRNRQTLSKMRTYMKKALEITKDTKKEDVEKTMKMAYSNIDKAMKKNMIHKNNAARKKSRIAREVAKMQKVSSAPDKESLKNVTS